MFKKVTKTVNRLSLREMAKLTGIGHSTLSRIEKGEDFQISTAKKILPLLAECPCCGKPTNTGSTP